MVLVGKWVVIFGGGVLVFDNVIVVLEVGVV